MIYKARLIKECMFAGTKAYWRDDKAKDPLFTWVKKDEALRHPTYKSFTHRRR